MTGAFRWSSTVAIGLRGLLLRKVRSLLSTVGIVFGVAAVVSMMSIGEGARREAIEQIRLLGTNNVRVVHVQLPGEMAIDAERLASRGLTYDDALLIRETLPALVTVAPLRFVNSEVRYRERHRVGQVVGTTPEYPRVTDSAIRAGRFIVELDLVGAKNVCVLGADVKDELFGPQDPLGAHMRLGEEWFTVVGVMEPRVVRQGKAAAINLRPINQDIYIPLTTALRRFSSAGDPSGIEEVAVRVTRAEQVPEIAGVIREILRGTHRGAQDFQVTVAAELLAHVEQTQRIFNVVMGSIAGISLLVGGIGIMNIMLANVSERTREIGIRRAIGATKNDILGQFLIETVLVSLVGGAIGILLGIGLAQAITQYAGWATGFSPVSVLIAFGTSASVGFIFGLFPARRAAELDPVQALRFE